MELKQLEKSDSQAIFDLEKVSAPDKPYYYKYDQEGLDFIFDHPKACKAFGLSEDNQLLGWGSYRAGWNKDNSQDGIYEISSIVINKNHRGKGYGKMMLDHIIKDIKQNQNFQKIYLTVYPQNLAPLFLYLKNGFMIYDFKKDVYGPGVDRLYLQLTNV